MPLTAMRPAGTPTIATPFGGAPPPGVEHLRLLPNAIMAPVGSEVVFKASICGCDGQLLTGRRVEWGISGAGQFTEMGTRQQLGYFSWPWEAPRIIAANHATGSTAVVATTLYRGTPDPNDDVPVERGESWVTVTSPCEGPGLVTACTPALGNHNRVTATVYWIDAQFLFPPSAVVEPGRPHVLTTTVLRRSDGAPLAGWTVRYDVASGASLGYEGGNFVEATTDAAGRASVEVSPSDASGGSTNVGVSIIRPAAAGAAGLPQLGLGRGNATVTWGAGAPAVAAPAPAVSGPAISGPPASLGPPPVSGPGPFQPDSTSPPSAGPAPSLPSGPASEVDPYRPPAGETQAGRPQLQLDLRRSGPERVGIGEYARFEVSLTNTGNATARGIVISAKFDRGLQHPEDKLNEFAVKYDRVRELPPGETTSVPLTYQVVAGGTQCHTVTVTAQDAEPVTQRACVSAVAPALEFSITGHRSRVVGEQAKFNVVVKNVGDARASNIEIVLRCDAALVPVDDPSFQKLPDGGLLLKIDDLVAPERRVIPLTARCQSPSDRACVRGEIQASGGFTAGAEACVEILPALPAGP
jgi:uncharacterized repeat protein (TIGR01451 family)